MESKKNYYQTYLQVRKFLKIYLEVKQKNVNKSVEKKYSCKLIMNNKSIAIIQIKKEISNYIRNNKFLFYRYTQMKKLTLSSRLVHNEMTFFNFDLKKKYSQLILFSDFN